MAKKSDLIIGFIIILIIGVSCYWVLNKFFQWIGSLDSDVAIATISGALTISGAVVATVIGKYYERKKEVEARFHSEKAAVYEEFIERFLNLFEENNENAEQELTAYISEWRRKILVIAGPDTIKKYANLMNYAVQNPDPDLKLVLLMEELFKSIRRDLGLSNKNLSKGFFATIILRNPDSFLHALEKGDHVKIADLED